MEQLVTALGPVFAVGIALQALFEWLDGPVLEGLLFNRVLKRVLEKKTTAGDAQSKKKFKSGVVRTIAIIIGIVVAITLDLKVLDAFESITRDFGLVDNLMAGLVISMGTDGINQIVKFVEKAKEKMDK